MSNKKSAISRVWERQAQNALKSPYSAIVKDFFLGESECATDQLENLIFSLCSGDVLIGDGNKEGENDIYVPLLYSLLKLQKTGIKNVHFIFMSAEAERVESFKRTLTQHNLNPSTDIHVHCCQSSQLNDYLKRDFINFWHPAEGEEYKSPCESPKKADAPVPLMTITQGFFDLSLSDSPRPASPRQELPQTETNGAQRKNFSMP